ncbi:ferredoxin reductase family protein [Marimonas lutisalis]|uniref:ferredoxin reductase family protein n=1 Tax=Marimonas lutisalis TaxID=2545756 RepID=UPI0019613ADA|nr:ferric reductase-like transmembrane domain-containing protein [Marimonas lutisalis]
MTHAPRTPRHASGALLALIYLAACLAPLALALLRPAAPADPWEHAAAGLGLVALSAMAVQFVTSGRFHVISARLGIDRIMAFHKIAAWWALAALLLHPLLFVLPTWAENPALGTERLTAYLTLPRYRTGVVALAALLLLVLSAALRERLPWQHETWRAGHLVLGMVAIFCGLHHAITAGRFSALGALNGFWWLTGLAVLLILATLYLWRWARLHRAPWRVASVTKRADRIWELDVQPAPGTPPLAYRAGQFAWITTGTHRFPLFDHPFSIADSPRRPGLSFLIKELGDFTSAVPALAPGTPVGIDGPYGNFTLQDHPGDAILLIAGGAGIGPIMGLLRDLAATGDTRPVRLAYAAGHPDNFACLDEIAAAQETLDLRTLLLSEEDTPSWQGQLGRLTHERLETMLSGLDPARSVAMICGPGRMITAVSDALGDLGMPMRNIVYERFDYAGGTSRQDRRHRRHFYGVLGIVALGTAGFALLA